jgi:3-vinyl bacteriochlorophyllide hydratase
MSDPSHPRTTPLYTPEQRWRRDHSAWTLVQGVLAPLQFVVFLISLALVTRTLVWGLDAEWALISVVVKTVVLYVIMVTGSIWEKVVFGQYLFAPSFFWEDVVSMGVMALHTAYVVGWWSGALSPGELLWLALAAYASYVINAVQFVWKLRAARLQCPPSPADDLTPSPSRYGRAT